MSSIREGVGYQVRDKKGGEDVKKERVLEIILEIKHRHKYYCILVKVVLVYQI